MRFDPALRFGIWLQRYKRFFVEVRTDEGEVLTLHCPNTGAMTGCSAVGARVGFQMANDPRRKLPGTLELVEVDGHWVGVHPARANRLVSDAIDAGLIEELQGMRVARREVRAPGMRSRFDLGLVGPEEALSGPAETLVGPSQALSDPVETLSGPEAKSCLVEVKSVSWVDEGGTALFPDAVSSRALRHVEELTVLRQRGERVALVFCVQHNGAQRFAPAMCIQPDYGAALQRAARAGVTLCAYRAEVSAHGIALVERLAVVLE